MSKKNIKQNYLLQIQKVLDKVEKSKDAASHFRCIVLMGDAQEEKAKSFLHASPEDLQNLILSAMRNSKQFTCAAANAFMQYDAELSEKEKSETKNIDNNEENPIQED
nr:hypothetical protein [uncultured Prevotella sp.]